jgi:lambda family phage portal protein
MAADDQGGYIAASHLRDSLSGWAPVPRDAVQDQNWGLGTMRGRSRDQTRNNPIAAGAQSTSVSHVVGSGLSLKPAIQREIIGLTKEAAAKWEANTKQRFNLYGNSKFFDVAGKLNFFESQQQVYGSKFESGDVFCVLTQKMRPNWPFDLAMQIIEADRCCNPNFGQDTTSRIAGIDFDADGEAKQYWFADRHPSASWMGAKWTGIPAYGESTGRRNVLHLADFVRPGQVRGVPVLAPVMESLKQLGRFTEAELEAAVQSAIDTFFVRMDPEAFRSTFNDKAREKYMAAAMEWDGGRRPGQAVNMLPGEVIDNPAPGRPNVNFGAFVDSVSTQLGMALQVPREVLFKVFASSYSAARAALLEAWRHFKLCRVWLATNYCQPVYEAWLDREVSVGRIAAPGYFNDPLVRLAYLGSEWRGDAPGSINPLDEARAAKLRLDMALTSRQDEKMEYDGGDWEVTLKQIEIEAAQMREANVMPVGGDAAQNSAIHAAPGATSPVSVP